jgi:DNA-binding MarR family transcriptional regulator
LEQTGLVRREPHPTDRRATQVRLTASGRRLAARLHADERRFGEMLVRGARPSELETFLSTLDQVLTRLHAMRSGAAEAA